MNQNYYCLRNEGGEERGRERGRKEGKREERNKEGREEERKEEREEERTRRAMCISVKWQLRKKAVDSSRRQKRTQALSKDHTSAANILAPFTEVIIPRAGLGSSRSLAFSP